MPGMKRAILVQRRTAGEKSLLYELAELAESAGYEVVGELEQVRVEDPKYNLGRGKVLELKRLIRQSRADAVIFFNELKPSQAYNLRKKLGVEVKDRFEIILEIFARRAGSREAKLQIELARLKRELSFAREYISLAKRGELHGFLGGGKYAVDTYYTYVSRRIARIERELRAIRRQKSVRWRRRVEAGLYSVSLTGYTGAGKTTLFKSLTGREGYIDGRPFATLSTLSKRIEINALPVLVSDTIGFIDSLPDALFDAFYTTLGENTLADLVLLVVDVAEPEDEIRRKLLASLSTLFSLAIPRNKILIAANKIDLLSEKELEERVRWLEKYGSTVVPVSAKTGAGISALKKAILDNLPGKTFEDLLLPYSQSYLIRDIGKKCRIVSLRDTGSGILLRLEGRREVISMYAGRARQAST